MANGSFSLNNPDDFSSARDWLLGDPDRSASLTSPTGGNWHKDANGNWINGHGAPVNKGDLVWAARTLGVSLSQMAKGINDHGGSAGGYAGGSAGHYAGGSAGGSPSYSQQLRDAEDQRIKVRNENALGQLEVTDRTREQARSLIKHLLGQVKTQQDLLKNKLAGHKQEYDADKNAALNTLKAAQKMYEGNTVENKKDWRYGTNTSKTNVGGAYSTAKNMLDQFGPGNSAGAQLAQGAVDTFNKALAENNQKYGTEQRKYDTDLETAKQQKDIDLQKAYDKYKLANIGEQAETYNAINDIYSKAQSAEMEYGTNMSAKKDKNGNPVIDKYGVVQMKIKPSSVMPVMDKYSKNNKPNYNFKRKYTGAVPIVKPKPVVSYARGENVGISKESTQSKY